MTNIKNSVTELVGKTPLLELTHIEEKYQLKDVSSLNLNILMRQVV